jgi:hypothetical protein
MKLFNLLVLLVTGFAFSANAQIDLTQAGFGTFRDTRIINGHSVETSGKGELKFIISHRFGNIKEGVNGFWGLDNATIRLGLDYGISNRLTVGIGRSSFDKTYDAFAKFRALIQNESVPLSITLFSSAAIVTIEESAFSYDIAISDRMTYAYQLLLSRAFGERFSLQLMPTLVHRNIVEEESNISNDVLALGGAFKFQITKNLALNTEYYYNLPDQLDERFNNSVSVGFDIITKGHAFQLSVSSSRGMVEKYFIGETVGDFFDGDLHIGFNITRDFQIGKKKYH